jgi:hypothetical protein
MLQELLLLAGSVLLLLFQRLQLRPLRLLSLYVLWHLFRFRRRSILIGIPHSIQASLARVD